MPENPSPDITPQPIAPDSLTAAPNISEPVQSEMPAPKKPTWIGIVLLCALLIFGVIGYYYFSTLATRGPGEPNTVGTITPPVETTSATEELVVEYIPIEKIYETVKLPGSFDAETSADGWFDEYEFSKVGTISSGKYRDGDLILVHLRLGGPCKGDGCFKPIRLRYVRNGTVATLLTKISSPAVSYRPNLLEANPFEQFGLSLETDSITTIPILEYPEEIQGSNLRQVVSSTYGAEEDGELDLSQLYKVFVDPLFGDIYTTRAELSLSQSFKTEMEGLGSRNGTYGCVDAGCFTTNQFYAFRPDGTFLRYGYTPDVSVEDIAWTDTKQTGSEYKSYTVAGCSQQVLDDNSVVAPSLVDDADLAAVGTANNTGDIIYELRDQNHRLYTEFYDTYKEYYAGEHMYPEELKQTKSFDDFIQARPLFLWRDPFGRLIRFNNSDFLPPAACEPIIYLYPETTQKVSIKIDNMVNITASLPEYQNGWHVIADPSGKIINPLDKRTYPYLFWEGWSLIFPIQEKGFVVEQSEVASFLSDTLAKLGLNEAEKADFLQSWLPEFSGHPYYFITFLDQVAIDAIAPLHISPKPDTVIRVLMDTKPLKQPITVVEPELKAAPERTGFTVVEWGGLKR